MNERIQQLAEQAEKYADANFKGEHFWTEAYESKFAELIVRDCMDVVDGYTKPRTFNTHYDAVEQIEALFGIKHFGVEPDVNENLRNRSTYFGNDI
jgi:hypothetical protein